MSALEGDLRGLFSLHNSRINFSKKECTKQIHFITPFHAENKEKDREIINHEH